MKAIVTGGSSAQPQLAWTDVPDITPGPREVLIRVKATAVNRADLLQARGLYPPPPGITNILGLEAAGDIVSLGEGVTAAQAGDAVFALLPGGSYAEYVNAHEAMLLPKPKEWSYADAAAIPEAWYTAFLNLFIEGALRAGERVLIHAGASGVGTAAIQLAREAHAEVFVTTGSEAKLQRCRTLGATGVNYKEQDFAEEIRKLTAGTGVDVILDCVGGSYLQKNLRLLRIGGRLVIIGLMGSREGTADFALLLGKRLHLIGSTLRNRSLEEKIQLTEKFKERCWPDLLAGRTKPVIDKVFPIEQAADAHEYMRLNKNIGKIILTVT